MAAKQPAVLKEDELAGTKRPDTPTEEMRQSETHTHSKETKCTGTWAVEIDWTMYRPARSASISRAAVLALTTSYGEKTRGDNTSKSGASLKLPSEMAYNRTERKETQVTCVLLVADREMGGIKHLRFTRLKGL
ncbi:hypothetical protein PPACK8108_LOCUS1562 [Phakopsora pachyrhizi]|uniref:Uncharacterized protein n=1 Tax=Phakopsora pachyrhizi TaxID=170000 RepID=A0AAV0AG75_PHAPC|nr:hypothetical protein PPACK8108_LOCUS1562 [Phakopsora pachyrhizi]